MTSDSTSNSPADARTFDSLMTEATEAYVWIWLPGEASPVVAGRLAFQSGSAVFNDGRSYLARMGASVPAIPIFEPELPLQRGALPPLQGLTIPGCIRDAAPALSRNKFSRWLTGGQV